LDPVSANHPARDMPTSPLLGFALTESEGVGGGGRVVVAVVVVLSYGGSVATKNNRHKRKPKLQANRARIDGKRWSKFNHYSRLSDGKPHPVTVRRVGERG
jgi:hypothetical protein